MAAGGGGARPEGMYVVKRSGEYEPVKFDAITDRISNLVKYPTPLSAFVDPVRAGRGGAGRGARSTRRGRSPR
jgi:hypothetical protein